MDVINLKDGSVEIIGSDSDLLDVIRDKCGDGVAAIVEKVIDWGNVYEAQKYIYKAKELCDNGPDNIEEIKKNIVEALYLLADVL